ncbi:MAG: hypothetical protein J6B71_05150 [Clostridia bacterium]|nr:hypothetical protein [Clostridia bacterium]
MFQRAKWIWPTDQFEKNQRAEFLFTAEVSEPLPSVILHIGCETKYWLFVNEELAVFDGGLFRESLPECGYYDRVDIAKYLHAGHNEIKLHVWYYGNGGRNNTHCEKAGLILSCEALSLYSCESTVCRIHTAYQAPSEKERTFLYGGNHTVYHATVQPFSLCPAIEPACGTATVLGAYGDRPWGNLIERCVPALFFTDRIACPSQKNATGYTVTLPYAMHFSPYFRVRATENVKIEVCSDRYCVNGGPGDLNRYFGHRAEYICREGEQEFELLDWIFGEKILFTIPDGVEVLELGYRESGYDSRVTTSFVTNDAQVNRLFEKCVRTLRVCMRENYMDCPDRERGQWIGDVSVQAPQVVYLLDRNGLLLLKKAILDFINLRKGDRLVGNVPGDNWSELPSQSLNAISEHGMIATYYHATQDKDILRASFEPAVRYLMLWGTDGDGVVLPRQGNWEWYDHLYNCDKPILNICWYYSALRFAKTMAEILDDHRFDSFLQERAHAIETHFEARYWKAEKRLGYYASNGVVDDRANAMAVLSGLCPKEKYPMIRYVLLSVFHSTPYMENYVLTALCEMGYKQDAFARMMSRYQPLIQNENSTLWEDFYHLGTRNHAWSGGPATVLLRYFAGIQPDLSVKQTEIAPLKCLTCSFVDPTTTKTVTVARQDGTV